MGFDEHGPAYPEKPDYVCPVCGVHDCDAYLRCYDPACLDGRDQSRLRPAHWDAEFFARNHQQGLTPEPRWKRLGVSAIVGATTGLFISFLVARLFH
jgi:hypothetical protein